MVITDELDFDRIFVKEATGRTPVENGAELLNLEVAYTKSSIAILQYRYDHFLLAAPNQSKIVPFHPSAISLILAYYPVSKATDWTNSCSTLPRRQSLS